MRRSRSVQMNRTITATSVPQIKSPNSANTILAAASRPWVIAILSIAALLYAAGGLRNARGFERADFSCYYLWAYAARQNLNPYTINFEPIAASMRLRTDGMDHADYPPTFILMFEPLTILSPQAAYRVWMGLNLAALIAALVFLLGNDSGLDNRVKIAFAALAFLFYPLRIHFNWAQTQLVLLLMLVLTGRWLARRRDGAAGLILALAGLLKIFPLFVVGYLLVERRWRALIFTGIGLALGAAATVVLIGVPGSVAFCARLANVFSGNWLAQHGKADSVELISLTTFVPRIFAAVTGARSGFVLDLARVAVVALGAVALLLLSVHATRTEPADENHRRRSFALWIVTAVLLSPTAWIHYMVLLLVPYAELAIAINRGEASPRAIWSGAASYGLAQLSPVMFAALQALLPMSVVTPIAQCWFPCATLLAYGSAYWLTVDPPPRDTFSPVGETQTRV